MNNGILQTALTRLPLELEYRPHSTFDESSATSEPAAHGVVLSGQYGTMREETQREEFQCLLSAI